MLTTVLAFLVALGLLIAVHEYGHYRMARACGVKVLRFSIGFGPSVWRWQKAGLPTEFAIGALPLGGYVKMLDEREGPVAPEELHLAFNTQPLRARAAIVAAGPIANLLLAVLLYAGVNWIGVQEAQAVLPAPTTDSIAARAGLQGGDEVLRAAPVDEPLEAVRSFDDFHWMLVRAALDGQDLQVEVRAPDRRAARTVTLPLAQLDARDADARLFRAIGILGPWTAPVLGDVQAGGAANAAGLQKGDRVLRIGGTPVADGPQLREAIRASTGGAAAGPRLWQIERAGRLMEVLVTAAVVTDKGETVGRIGALVGGPPAMLTVRYGVVEGLWRGAVRTWEVSTLTLRMMGRMVIGEASLKNLSGPLTIADYAGRSANMGFTQYLVFLALISVSLGVLNLLPLPVLDGGHLAMYLWEGVTGRAVSDAWLERLQRGGVALLLVMMSIALFNDVSRLLG